MGFSLRRHGSVGLIGGKLKGSLRRRIGRCMLQRMTTKKPLGVGLRDQVRGRGELVRAPSERVPGVHPPGRTRPGRGDHRRGRWRVDTGRRFAGGWLRQHHGARHLGHRARRHAAPPRPCRPEREVACRGCVDCRPARCGIRRLARPSRVPFPDPRRTAAALCSAGAQVAEARRLRHRRHLRPAGAAAVQRPAGVALFGRRAAQHLRSTRSNCSTAASSSTPRPGARASSSSTASAGGRLRRPELVPRACTLRPRAARQRAGAAHC